MQYGTLPTKPKVPQRPITLMHRLKMDFSYHLSPFNFPRLTPSHNELSLSTGDLEVGSGRRSGPAVLSHFHPVAPCNSGELWWTYCQDRNIGEEYFTSFTSPLEAYKSLKAAHFAVSIQYSYGMIAKIEGLRRS